MQRPTTSARHALQAHACTPCAAVRQLEVTISTGPRENTWRLRYALTADLHLLRLPVRSTRPGPADGLWRQTCFEAFAGTMDDTGYHEFNFSPSGDWAIFAFTDERIRSTHQPAWQAHHLLRHHDTDRLVLDAWLSPDSQGPAGDDWRLGLSAVIETNDGELSYWALAHPSSRPDFHHRGGWTARLPFLGQT